MKKRLNLTAAYLAAFLLVFCAGYRVEAAPTVTPGGLLQFDSQSEFENAFPGLPKEDFEESPVAPGTVGFCDRIDHTTNVAGVFSPGDILDGLALEATGTARTGCPGECTMVVVGSGSGGWAPGSVSISTWTAVDPTGIVFAGMGVNAVGFDLTSFALDTATISVYGASGLIDTLSVAVAPVIQTFTGMYSSQPVTRIDIASGVFRLVDNVQFGAITQDVTFYTDQAAFEAAHPGLPVEDFEESPVASGSFVLFPEPLDSTTNAPGAFSPGDIVEGLTVRTMSTADPSTALAVIGDHLHVEVNMDNVSKMVCTANPEDNLLFYLNPSNVCSYAVGMDLMAGVESGSPDQTAYICVYGIGGRILGTTAVSLASTGETFVGVHSNHLITGTTVVIGGTPERECVDNIRFGGSPQDLTFYTSETEFNKARGTLPVEDFSESTVADGEEQLCDEPLNSSSNQAGCFSAGDIKPKVSFQTVDSLGAGCPTCMVVVGRNSGTLGNANPLVAALPPDTLEISFTGNNIFFAGMDLYVYNPVLFHIYDLHDTFLGEAVGFFSSTAGFWGVRSGKPLGRIAAATPTIIGDVRFGSRFPWAMFLPAKYTAP